MLISRISRWSVQPGKCTAKHKKEENITPVCELGAIGNNIYNTEKSKEIEYLEKCKDCLLNYSEVFGFYRCHFWNLQNSKTKLI